MKTIANIPTQEILKTLCLAPCCMLLLVLFAAIAHAGSIDKVILNPEERLWLTENQSRIVLAVETAYPPFVFIDSNDQPTGLAQDFMLLLESKLGVHFKQRRFSSLDDIFEKVRSGEVHVVNAVTKTPLRSTFLTFTEPFVSLPNAIIVRNERSGRMHEEDLSGLKVSLVRSYAVTEHLVQKRLGFLPDLVPDDLTALLNVSFGRSDAAVIDLATASYLISQKGITNLRVAGEATFDIQLAIGTPIDEPVLHSIIQKGLAAITDKERETIRKRWINISRSSILSDRRFLGVVGGVLSVVFAVIVGMLIWNRTLRQQVALRTRALNTEKEALRESEEQFKAIFEMASIGITQADPKTGQWLRVNHKMSEITGYSTVEMLSMRVPEITHPEDRERDWAAFQDVINNRLKNYCMETRYVRKDGSVVWVNVNMTAIRDSVGQPTYTLATIEDITERKRAEEALRESEQRYRRLSENSPDMIYRMSLPDGRYEYVSKAATGIFGYPPEEWYDNPLLVREIIHPAWHSYFEEQWKNLLKGHVPPTYEYKTVHRNGSVRWMNQRNILVMDDDSRPVAIEGIVTDITDRKQSEQDLQDSKRLLEVSGSIARVGGWTLDAMTLELSWTEETCLIHEVPSDYGPHFQEAIDFYHPEDRDKLRMAIERALEAGEPYDMEIRLITAKGKHLWTRTICNAQVEDGKTVRLNGCLQDITDRKGSEQALHLHLAILETVAEGIFLVGVDDNTIKWTNRKLEEMFGYDPGEMIGMHVDRINAPTDKTPSETRMSIVDPLLQTGEWQGEIQNIKKDGSQFWCYIHVSLFDHPQFGKVMVSAHTDITQRKEAEEQKDKIETQLRQAQKLEAVGRLAGGVAHDFNNMLSIIIGHAELILDETATDSPLQHDITEIRTAAQRSADLTRQLLAFARKQTISPKVLDLNETASGMLKLLRRVIGEDIDLAWVPGVDVWPVKMDPGQLDQILANLAVNARDAIGGVGIMTIETANAVFDEKCCQTHKEFIPGDYAMLAVSDTGAGMQQETLDRIFEPFFTTKELGKGTGLGLATVYGIVKQNNGFINVYSEPGHGTTFKIYIPRAEHPVVEGSAHAMKKDLKGTETVLLVEDEESILALGKSILERRGYVVLAARSPGEALKMALSYKGPIHLLVTDVVMPEMNGKDLKDKLIEVKPGFKSIFMSGYTANVIAHHGVLDEGVDFLQKPFSVQGFAEKVRKVLDA